MGPCLCSAVDDLFLTQVLFALCAPLAPNGRPPAVVTVSWLYASLEKGFFVDSEAFRPGRYAREFLLPPMVGRGGCPGRPQQSVVACVCQRSSFCSLSGFQSMNSGRVVGWGSRGGLFVGAVVIGPPLRISGLWSRRGFSDRSHRSIIVRGRRQGGRSSKSDVPHTRVQAADTPTASSRHGPAETGLNTSRPVSPPAALRSQ